MTVRPQFRGCGSIFFKIVAKARFFEGKRTLAVQMGKRASVVQGQEKAMSSYRLTVIEVQYVKCTYHVTAATSKEAITLAEAGNTVSEDQVEEYEVMGRFVVGTPRRKR